MRVLITGVQNVVKDSAVKLALERLEGKIDFRTLAFSNFSEDDIEPGEELKLLKAMQKKITDNMQMKIIKSGKSHMIIEGYCTVNTRLGFYPVITKEAAGIISPDLVIYIRVHPDSLEGRVEDPVGFQEHQDAEEMFSASLASDSGCALKVINCGMEGARKASEDLRLMLKEVLA